MIELTPEQNTFAIFPSDAFVHACPGSGKTQTILARLARIAAELPSRRGVAVLSFTNSAVDEFLGRCREARLDSYIRFPSFMGTLDSFVRHFVVLPCYVTEKTIKPIIVDSWDRIGIEIRISGRYAFRGNGVSLDLFDPETNEIDPERVGHTGLRNHLRQYQERYRQNAAKRRRGLFRAGYLSAADARVKTLQVISDQASSDALGNAIAARFCEVIVDEGQDCNPLDLQILSWLRQHGVKVTIVCDPDQSIYEFRDGSPEELHAFKETYPITSHLGLTGNFRSGPVICQLAATFKGAGQEDDAVGDNANVQHPIVLFAYIGQRPNATIGQAFLEEVAAIESEPMDAIILAHSGRTAQHAAINSVYSDSSGQSRIAVLARTVAEFWSSGSTARSKEAAVQKMEVALLQLMNLSEEGEHHLRAIERNNVDRRLLRRRALNFLMSLPRTCEDTDASRSAWIASVHSGIERLSLPLPEGRTVGSFFRSPSNSRWSRSLQVPMGSQPPHAKIHEAKGHQYDAVCVVIPPNRAPNNHTETFFHAWENRSDIEAKRVIYVGVTRAKRLAALAIPFDYADRCVSLLAANEVPHVRRDV